MSNTVNKGHKACSNCLNWRRFIRPAWVGNCFFHNMETKESEMCKNHISQYLRKTRPRIKANIELIERERA